MSYLKLLRDGRDIVLARDASRSPYRYRWKLADDISLARVLRLVAKVGQQCEQRANAWYCRDRFGDEWSARISRELDAGGAVVTIKLKHTRERLPRRYRGRLRDKRPVPEPLNLTERVTLPSASVKDMPALRNLVQPHASLSGRLRTAQYAFDQGVEQSRLIMQAASAQYAAALQAIFSDAVAATQRANAKIYKLKQAALNDFADCVISVVSSIVLSDQSPRTV